jgi:hypothetical protein
VPSTSTVPPWWTGSWSQPGPGQTTRRGCGRSWRYCGRRHQPRRRVPNKLSRARPGSLVTAPVGSRRERGGQCRGYLLAPKGHPGSDRGDRHWGRCVVGVELQRGALPHDRTALAGHLRHGSASVPGQVRETKPGHPAGRLDDVTPMPGPALVLSRRRGLVVPGVPPRAAPLWSRCPLPGHHGNGAADT